MSEPSSTNEHGNEKLASIAGTDEDPRVLAGRVVHALYRLVKGYFLHDDGNQALVPMVEFVIESVRLFCEKSASPQTSVLFANNSVFVNRQMLRASRDTYQLALELGATLESCHITEVTIEPQVTATEVMEFGRAIAQTHRERNQSSKLTSEGTWKHLRARKVVGFAGGEILPPVTRVARMYAASIMIIRRFNADLRKGKLELSHSLKRVAQKIAGVPEDERRLLLSAAASPPGDADRAGVTFSASVISVCMASEITKDRSALTNLAMAALLYDAARVRVSSSPGPNGGTIERTLNEEEEEQLPTASVIVLTALGRLHSPSVTRSVLVHEALALRSSVAPYGGARPAHILSKVLHLARMFTELRVARGTSQPLSADDAIDVLAGQAHDNTERALVKLLIGTLGIFPAGTMVELNTGELAVVVETPKLAIDFARPPIRVMYDDKSQLLDAPIDVDLAAQTSAPLRSIAKTVDASDQQMKQMRAYVMSLGAKKRARSEARDAQAKRGEIHPALRRPSAPSIPAQLASASDPSPLSKPAPQSKPISSSQPTAGGANAPPDSIARDSEPPQAVGRGSAPVITTAPLSTGPHSDRPRRRLSAPQIAIPLSEARIEKPRGEQSGSAASKGSGLAAKDSGFGVLFPLEKPAAGESSAEKAPSSSVAAASMAAASMAAGAKAPESSLNPASVNPVSAKPPSSSPSSLSSLTPLSAPPSSKPKSSETGEDGPSSGKPSSEKKSSPVTPRVDALPKGAKSLIANPPVVNDRPRKWDPRSEEEPPPETVKKRDPLAPMKTLEKLPSIQVPPALRDESTPLPSSSSLKSVPPASIKIDEALIKSKEDDYGSLFHTGSRGSDVRGGSGKSGATLQVDWGALQDKEALAEAASSDASETDAILAAYLSDALPVPHSGGAQAGGAEPDSSAGPLSGRASGGLRWEGQSSHGTNSSAGQSSHGSSHGQSSHGQSSHGQSSHGKSSVGAHSSHGTPLDVDKNRASNNGLRWDGKSSHGQTPAAVAVAPRDAATGGLRWNRPSEVNANAATPIPSSVDNSAVDTPSSHAQNPLSSPNSASVSSPGSNPSSSHGSSPGTDSGAQSLRGRAKAGGQSWGSKPNRK